MYVHRHRRHTKGCHHLFSASALHRLSRPARVRLYLPYLPYLPCRPCRPCRLFRPSAPTRQSNYSRRNHRCTSTVRIRYIPAVQFVFRLRRHFPSARQVRQDRGKRRHFHPHIATGYCCRYCGIRFLCRRYPQRLRRFWCWTVPIPFLCLSRRRLQMYRWYPPAVRCMYKKALPQKAEFRSHAQTPRHPCASRYDSRHRDV